MMDNRLLNQPSALSFEEREESGTFAALWSFLRRFIVLILAFTVLGLGLGLGLAFVKDKTVYTQKKSVILILRIDNAAMTTNISLTNMYTETIEKGEIKESVFIKKANENYSAYCAENGKTKQGTISSGAIGVKKGQGLIFTFSYSDLSAQAAEDKLDAYIEAVKTEVQGLWTADDVEILPIDNVPTTSSSNGFARYVSLGLLGGLVIGVALAFLFYLLDTTVSSKAELERLTGTTVIAYIDDVEKTK